MPAEYGFDWFSPAGTFSGWSTGDVPEDMAALGWYSIERGQSSRSRETGDDR